MLFSDTLVQVLVLTAFALLYKHPYMAFTVLLLAFFICYFGGLDAKRLRMIADKDADHFYSVCRTQKSCLTKTKLRGERLQKELNELQQQLWLETLSNRVGSQV